MSLPVVTISMPTYNVENRVLRRAIQSVMSQTMPHWNLVVVNDGGDSAEFMRAFEGIDDPRIKIIDCPENLGTYARHAQVLEGTQTQWWSPHDSDDYISADRYEHLLSATGDGTYDVPEDHAGDPDRVDVVLGGYVNIGINGNLHTTKPRKTAISHEWMRCYSLWGATLWSADWLRSIGGINPIFRTSYDSMLQTLACRFGSIRTIPHIGYFRQVRKNSLTVSSETKHGSLYRTSVQRHMSEMIDRIGDNATLADVAAIVSDCTPVRKLTAPIKVVVNMICLNSEPELPSMLESLIRDGVPSIDGLVVVDGGSTDGTVETICRWATTYPSLPVHVETVPWPDDFAKQRNVCLDITRSLFGITTHNKEVWVLMIDSDDTLVDFDRSYVEEVVRTCEVNSVQTTMDNGCSRFCVTNMFRLSDDVAWHNPIHEFVRCNGKTAILPDGKLRVVRGRGRQHDNDPTRNVRIGRRFVEQSPCDRRGRFYLARDLIECRAVPFMERMAEAEGHLRIYMTLPGNFVEQDRLARLLLCKIMWDTGRSEEARRLVLDSLMDDPDNRSAYIAMEAMTGNPVWKTIAGAVDGECVLSPTTYIPHPRQHLLQ